MNMEAINQIEEQRKIPVKYVVFSDGWYLCGTNWSKSYSAGVMEFSTSEAANEERRRRTADRCVLHGFNSRGERIL